MCLIATSQTGKQIPRQHLQNAYYTNSDGAGWAYVKNNRLYTDKGIWSFHQFYSSYEENCVGYPHIIHLRNMSSPPRLLENTHPFYISNDAVLVHNGNFKSFPSKNMVSDTRQFVNRIIKPLTAKNPNWYKEMQFSWLVEQAIGESNKLAVIDNTGFIKIFSEKQGKWKNDIWYSNDSYKNLSNNLGEFYSIIYENELPFLENLNLTDEKTLDEIDNLLESY